MKQLQIFVFLAFLVFALVAAHAHDHHNHDGHVHHHENPHASEHEGHSHHADHHHEHSHHHEHHHDEHESGKHSSLISFIPSDKPILTTFIALSVTTTIPILIITFIPSQIPHSILNVCVSFAVGAVLGDVFLHLLPEVMGAAAVADALNHNHEHSDGGHHSHSHSHQHSHAAMEIGLVVVAGMIAFFGIQKVTSSLSGGSCHSHGHSHDHGHSHAEHKHDHDHHHESNSHSDHSEDHQETLPKADSKMSLNDADSKSPKLRRRKGKSKKSKDSKPKEAHQEHSAVTTAQLTQAFLQTVAGATHCFADGLTVCLSFIASPAAGMSTTFAMLLHEIPHKLGDYALLRGKGLPKDVAIRFTILGSIGSFLGALFGASIWWYANSVSGGEVQGENTFLNNKVMPFTAGGLLYMSLVGVLPELAETPSGIKGVMQTLLFIAGMSGGVAVMANMHH